MSAIQQVLLGYGSNFLAPSYVGGDATIDVSSATPSVTVPGGAVNGDTMVVILRCREDRSFTIPGGWTTHVSRAVSASSSGTSYTRVYIISKARSGETSLSFTQSAAAACSASLAVFRNGTVGVNANNDTNIIGITKASSSSILLAVSLKSSTGVTTPGNPIFAGYTQRGVAKWSAGGDWFYATGFETLSGAPSGSATATATWTGPADQSASWLAEIG